METATQLVGRQVLRNFGKHGIHKGTIISYDDDGELTFRIEYQDGDAEDLAEDDVRATLIDKDFVRVASRSRRDKEADESESDYIPEDGSVQHHVQEVISSQATTQAMELNIADEAGPPIIIVASDVPVTVTRKRSTPAQRQQSASALWVKSPCPVAIYVHYNAVDRGLCSQTLREHHTILERAMVRLFPRFKWGRSHYLQVFIPYFSNTRPYALPSVLTTSFLEGSRG
jgi:hypothetical protein